VGVTLSKEQRAAVEHAGGPLIVLAGPGTGKTRVITARVAHLIQERGVNPESVLSVTFTNKAAGELRERLAALIDPVVVARMRACTMHAFGMHILRRFGDMLGLPGEVELLDVAQQRRMAREIIRAEGLYRASIGRGIDAAVEHGLSVSRELVSLGVEPGEALARCDREEQALAGDGSPEARAARAELAMFREAAQLAAHMDRRCLEEGTARFDDLIRWPIALLRASVLARDIVRQECRHVLLDEFQDLNATQIAFLAEICPPGSNPDLCVVGDDDQSIYAFRGADERAFERFEATWPGTTTLKLTTNYRSGAKIVGASNRIISLAGSRFAPDKVGVSGEGAPAGSSVEMVRVANADAGADAIAAMIGRMREDDPAIDLTEIAVIARTNNDLLRVRAALDVIGVPSVSSVSDASHEDAGVQGVLDWCNLLVDPTRTWAARSILAHAPFHLPAPAVGVLEGRYRRERSLAEEGEAPDPGPFMAWAAANAPAGMEEALARAAAMEGVLAKAVSGRPADDALMRIIRQTGVAHAEELGERERAARVRSLVGLVRFVRGRLWRLDQPRDLRALLAYMDDLPESEKRFSPTPEETLDPPESEGVEGDGVRLLTAHASKGLEFDTVFIQQCWPAHGFPKSRSEDPLVPPSIAGADPHGRSAAERRMDEERRVFFVALTRAKRRAVLMAKPPKGKPSSTHFPLELLADPDVGIIDRDASDLPGLEGDELDGIEREGLGADDRAAVLHAARRSVRRAAARALDAAERSDTPGVADDDLLRSASLLAMIAHVERTESIPKWARAAGVYDEAARLVDRLRARRAASEASRSPCPLRLSYTRIKQYLDCPLCYRLKYELKLPEPATAATSLGSALHKALELFMRRWADADNEGRPTPGWAELEEETRRQFFAMWPKDTEVNHDELVRAFGQARMYWDHMHDPRAELTDRFECEFVLPYECDGISHSIAGKIDRIDRLPTGGWKVIDYKTGNPRKALLEPANDDLQLGIYAMALPVLFPGDDCSGSVGEYWMLASGEKGSISLDSLRMDKIRKNIDKAIRGITQGHFPKGRDCGGVCAFLDEPDPLAPDPA